MWDKIKNLSTGYKILLGILLLVLVFVIFYGVALLWFKWSSEDSSAFSAIISVGVLIYGIDKIYGIDEIYTYIKKRNNPDYGRDPQVVAYEQRNPSRLP
jgi:protein-S-isoprenylcysteine O-methyltransferase Ste14